MTICYFTASGNCLYAARRIGGTLLSIPQLMRQEKIEIVDDAVGIVCPVYAVELPFMIVDFMKKADIKTDYFFFIHISADERAEKVMENQSVIRQPIVRNGRQATVGYAPDVWKTWQ